MLFRSRVLVLVDGVRWVNESSASGVSGSADLNTIPMSIVDHVEVLEDGASAIYGSDAIAGVVNIITRKKLDGVEVKAYAGDYKYGGMTKDGSVTVGGATDRFSGLFVASYYDQQPISSGNWWQSTFPEPYAGLAAGSSATPQGRFTFCDPRGAPPAYGSCTPEDIGERPALFIVGGVGVAPARAMIEHMTTANRPVVLFRASNPQDLLHLDELRLLASERGGDVRTLVGPTASLAVRDPFSADLLQQAVPDLLQRSIVVCGPDRLVAAARHGLRAAGVRPSSIHYERSWW